MEEITAQITVADVLCSRDDWHLILTTDSEKISGTRHTKPVEGDVLEITGHWYEWNGDTRFKFSRSSEVLPTDWKSRLDHVCERIWGAGPKLAERLWNDYGSKWPEKLVEAEYVTAGMVVEMQQLLAKLQVKGSHEETLEWLTTHKVPEAIAESAWRKWGMKTIDVIRKDCFKLTWIEGCAFKTVDTGIRLALDMADDDDRRTIAAVWDAFKTSSDTAMQPFHLMKRVASRLYDDMDLARFTMVKLQQDNKLLEYPSGKLTTKTNKTRAQLILEYCNGN